MARILGDCRDIAIHRLLQSFTALLDRVGDMLMDRASRTDVREDQTACLEARDVLLQSKSALLVEFERRLRTQVDDRIDGKIAPKTEFAKLESDKLTLIDTHAMDEAVVTGNITRVVENLCHDELQLLNRGIGHLLGKPDLETDRNPFAPARDRRRLCRRAAVDQDRAGGQVHDPEGAEPGIAGGDQRHLRGHQQAPAEPARHACRHQPAPPDSSQRRAEPSPRPKRARSKAKARRQSTARQRHREKSI